MLVAIPFLIKIGSRHPSECEQADAYSSLQFRTYLAPRACGGATIIGPLGVIDGVVIIASPQQTAKADQSQQTNPTVIVMFGAISAIIHGGSVSGGGSVGSRGSSRRRLASRAQRRQGERSRYRGVGA